ncbi:MAG: hypothetical protein ACPGWR_15635 [Ardenticatenaceae bacterium]
MFMKRIIRSAILLVALIISACSSPIAGEGEIQFKEIFESRSFGNQIEVENTYEMDVDGDGLLEWVVLYRFDPTQEQPQESADRWSNTPIQGMVYDALPCDPPLLYNWYLPVPDNDYLGEGNSSDGQDISAYTDDWLNSNENEAENELIINGPGPVNTLSIYRFRHNNKNGCQKPSHNTEGFDLLGFFRSNGPINPNLGDDGKVQSINTYERIGYERSQLAIRSTYEPISDTNKSHQTFIKNNRTVNPTEQTIDFLYGQPESPQDSPYPEKAVAAFYLSVGEQENNQRAYDFLETKEGYTFENFLEAPGWGLDIPPKDIDHVLIHSISYTPDVNKERAHQTRQVTVHVKPIPKNGSDLGARKITLQVVGVPVDGDEVDCEWRLQEVKKVEVTEGLGMLTR